VWLCSNEEERFESHWQSVWQSVVGAKRSGWCGKRSGWMSINFWLFMALWLFMAFYRSFLALDGFRGSLWLFMALYGFFNLKKPKIKSRESLLALTLQESLLHFL
jgi:hypothetical protein